MESALIRKAKMGDRDAQNALLSNHKDLAFSVALRITNNHQDAEDITQESFIKAFENLKRFKEESKFSTWLFRIVHNESLMLLRKKRKSTEILDEPILEVADEKESDTFSENYKNLSSALHALSVNERNLIDLFYLGEKSIKEIHQITGISKGNIKVILHRSRTKLRNQLNHG